MIEQTTSRGFQYIEHDLYGQLPRSLVTKGRLIGQSSAASEPKLWVGDPNGLHHLNKAEVVKLIDYLTTWVQSDGMVLFDSPAEGEIDTTITPPFSPVGG